MCFQWWFLLILASQSVAATPSQGPLIGSEFTVILPGHRNLGDGDQESIDDNGARKAEIVRAWIERAKIKCRKDPRCRKVKTVWNEVLRPGFETGEEYYHHVWFEIFFHDGLKLQITDDPFVFEFKMPWKNRRWWEGHKNLIQEYVFDEASMLGLKPHPDVGMGHFTFELQSTFGTNPFLLRQFLADRFNHPELALGILSDDMMNASPLASFPPGKVRRLQKLLRAVDEGKIRTTQELIWAIYKSDLFYYSRSSEIRVSRNSVEDRALRSQMNVQEFLLIADLKLARVEYLKTIKDPIPLRNILAGRSSLSEAERVVRFRSMVEEMGQDFRKYRVLIPSELLIHTDVQKVLRDELSLVNLDLPPEAGTELAPIAWKDVVEAAKFDFDATQALSADSAEEALQMLEDFMNVPRNEEHRRQLAGFISDDLIRKSDQFLRLDPTEEQIERFERFRLGRTQSPCESLLQKFKRAVFRR